MYRYNVCACVHVGTHACLCLWGSEVIVGYVPPLLHFWSLTESVITDWLDRLSLPYSHWHYRCTPPQLSLEVGSGALNSDLQPYLVGSFLTEPPFQSSILKFDELGEKSQDEQYFQKDHRMEIPELLPSTHPNFSYDLLFKPQSKSSRMKVSRSLARV